jgi:uncharacterized membrane-anchored protein YjiN (DUF445 family)
MSIGQGDKYIKSLYDTLLDRAIGFVLQAFTSGSASMAWDSLQTLYDVLDENIKDECKGLIDEVETHITIELRKRGYAQSDVLFRRLYIESYVANKKHELFDKIIRLLKKHGYLQKTWTPIDKKDFEGLEGEEK